MKILKQLTEKFKALFRRFRLAKQIDYLIQYHVKIFTIAISILAIWRFIAECKDNGYTITQVITPAILQAKGYDASLISREILKNFQEVVKHKVQASSRGAVLLNLMGFNAPSIIKIADYSNLDAYNIKGLFWLGKRLLNIKSNTIQIYISQGDSCFIVKMYINDKPLPDVRLQEKDVSIDSLAQRSAITILERTYPIFLARKYLSENKVVEAENLLQRVNISLLNNVKSDDCQLQMQMFIINIYKLLHDNRNVHRDDNLSIKYLDRCKQALDSCDAFKKRYPKDIAPYVLKMSILKSAAMQIENYLSGNIVYKDRIKYYSKAGLRTYQEYQQVWWKRSSYFEEARALAIMDACCAYFKYNYGEDEPNRAEIEALLDNAQTLLPNNAHIQNDIIYYYMKVKEFDKADKVAERILGIFPHDNNLWDTRAEVNYKSGLVQNFYEYLTKAIEYPDSLTGFVPEAYRNDSRWPEELNKPEYLRAIDLEL